MKTLKKVTAVLLAAVMVLSMAVTGENTVQASDTSLESAEYTPLVIGETQTVSITEGGQKAYFSFVPEVSGTYIFQSSSAGMSCDTYVNLYQKTATGIVQLAYDDDSGSDRNFMLSYSYVAGETYYLVARAYSSSFVGEFNVSLTEPPIQSIVMKPISIIENYRGYYNNQGTDDEYFYYYWHEFMEYTITMRDGMVIEGKGTGFTYNDQWYSFSRTDDQHDNPWTLGNTYTPSVSVMGYTAEVQVTIVETPVESVTVEPISLIESSTGYTNTTEDGEEYFHYQWQDRLEYTITMKDGSVIEGMDRGFYYDGEWYSLPITDNQYASHWTVGNTYRPTIDILGYKVEAEVTITDTPIESIAVEKISMIENSRGNMYNEGTEDEYFNYCWWEQLTYTITMKDGSVIEGAGSGFWYNEEWYSFHTRDDQYENHWTVGNTYTVQIATMGYEAEVHVTIAETPIANIDFEPISMIEGFGGWLEYYGSENEFYYYDWGNNLEYTITMTDGTTIEGKSQDFEYDGQSYHLQTYDDQYENHWTVGNTYKPTVSVMGYTTDVEVSIIDTPVQSVVFEPISFIEGTGGSICWEDTEDEFYRYEWSNRLEYTITMKNGDVIEGEERWLEYDGEEFFIQCHDEQDTNPWVPGNTYTQSVNILGYDAEVSVTITESPIESIEIEPIAIAENTHGGMSTHWNNGVENVYYRYYWEQLVEYTITMKDGSVITGSGTDFKYDGEWYYFSSTNEQYENHWYAGGVYTEEIRVLGKTAEVTVSILEVNQTDGFEYMVQNGNAIIIGSNLEEKILNIPSNIDGYPVVGITDLTEAMEYAEELVIPDGVTMLSTDLFSWNYTLKKLTLGAGVSNLSNDKFLFSGELEEIHISPENPKYTSVDGVVYNKDMTTLVVFPRGKSGTYTVPNTVTDISVLVNNISYYDITLDLGNSSTDYSVEDGVIYNADKTVVYGCDRNKTGTYTMPDSVTKISDGAFKDCSFSEVIVSANVSEIVYEAFSYSVELEKVVLPENLKSISWGAFYDCENLEVADLPSSLELIETGAFQNTGILKAEIPGSVKEVGYAAYKESQVAELTLAEGIESIYSEAFAGTKVTEVVLPDSLIELDSYAFANTPLESVTIGRGLERISSHVFENTGLTTVTIPENVAEIYHYAFANSKLEEAIIEKNDVYIYEGAFYNCPLKEIDLSEGTICVGDYAFFGSEAESIVIPESVTDVTYKSFAESKQLTNIEVHEELDSLDGTAFDGTAWWEAQADGVVYLDNYLYGYKGVMPEGTEITVRDNTTLIANYAFERELNLKALNLPASLRGIGHGAFADCLGLEKITVNEANTNYSTNADETILYDAEGEPVWRKIETLAEVYDLKTYFEYGEEFRGYRGGDGYWDVELEVEYADGHWGYIWFPITIDMISGFDSTKPGYQTVTIDFGRFNYEYEVYIEEPTVEEVVLEKLPNKTVYDLNQEFRTTGMVLKGICENGAEIEITDYEISGFDSSVSGIQTITVTYGDYEFQFNVEVKADQITFVANTVTEEKKVEVSAPIESIEEGAVLVVEQVANEEVEDVEPPAEFTEENSLIFDIRFEKEEEVVQPTTTVTVSIPVPTGFDGRNCKVFHIGSEGNVDMNASFVDGYLVFETTHFSYYAVHQQDGVSVSGIITSSGAVDGEVTVNLMKDTEVYQTVNTTDGTYTFTNVLDGEYTITVAKENHATRSYTVVVGDTDTVHDAKIHLLGDIDGDGILNVMDANQIILHARGVALLSGYEYECANIDGNEVVNVIDANNAIMHARGKVELW